MDGLNMHVTALSEPAGLNTQVDTLAFGHLVLYVTVHRVVFFRDAIFNLSLVDFGSKRSQEAYEGLRALLNVVFCGIICTRVHYADRAGTPTICKDLFSPLPL